MKKNKYRKLSLISDVLISIIIVVKNDEDLIENYINEIKDSLAKYELYEIIIIDNGSTDETVESVAKLRKTIPQLRLLCLSKENDIQVALTAGFDSCIGDYVIALNIYLDSPKIIKQIILALKKYEIVVVNNIHEFYPKDSLSIRLFKSFLSKLLKRPSLNDPGIFASGYTRSSIVSMTKVRRKNRFNNYLVRLIGLKLKLINVKIAPPRISKYRSLNFLRYIWYLLDASISSSFRPLRVLSLFSLFASLINLLFIVYVFIITIIKTDIAEGWITTSLIIGTMFFMLFIILAVISEYVLRILQESRDEPIYFISREIDGGILLSRKKLNVR